MVHVFMSAKDSFTNLERFKRVKVVSYLTGVMTVRSGKWLPPHDGWLHKMTSPSLILSPNSFI